MTTEPAPGNGGAKSRKRYHRMMKIVRRIHMYTGLILLPWVIFFGFSGMLFNHPEWLGSTDVLTHRSAAEVDGIHSFAEPDAEAIADEVVARLNQEAGDERYVRAGRDAVLEGSLTYQCETDQGETSVVISPNGGHALLKVSPKEAKPLQPEFNGKRIEIDSFDADQAGALAEALLADAGLTPASPLETAERAGAEVRFRLRSEDGQMWNVSYALFGGGINARASDAAGETDFYSVVSRLHKTHHYPDRLSARWLWSLVADATGITMVFWGLSGAVMWWQIKPTRMVGVAGLSVAAVAAAFLFTGTFSNLTFVPRQSKGGGPPPSERQKPGETETGESPSPDEKQTSTVDPVEKLPVIRAEL